MHLALQSGSRISVSFDFTLTLNAVWSEQKTLAKEQAISNEVLCVMPLKGSNT